MGYSSYNYYGSYPSDYAVSSAAVAALSAVIMVYAIIILAIAIIQIIAMWKLFNKAGEKGWKSIIPIYNMVILFKISGLSPWLILVYLAAIIPFIGWVAPIVMNAVLSYKLAKSFGKDGGWAVGLYFLPSIFYMILAFGKSVYVGPDEEQATDEAEVSTEETEKNEENN